MSPVPANNREPNKQDEHDVNSTDAPQFVITNSDSDSDGDEGDGYQGYQLLPQDPESIVVENIEDSLPSDSGTVNLTNMDSAIMQALDSQDMLAATAPQGQLDESQEAPSETVELWNTENSNPASQEPMDPEHAEKIKTAMAGFVLPPNAQPAWASHLSDEEWKQALMKKGSLNLPSASRYGQSCRSDVKGKDKLLER